MSRTSDVAVIFGGAGFIGTHLCRQLSDHGTQVIVADIAQPREGRYYSQYQYCDVRKRIQIKLPSNCHTIYNLAAIHRTPGHKPHEYFETNVGGATNIAAWATSNQVEHLLFASSIAVYGPTSETVSESQTPSPLSDYGHSKLLAEQIQREWASGDSKRRLRIVRPAVIFGPGEGGNFTRMAHALEAGRFVKPGRTNTVKACGYVTDLIAAIQFMAEQDDKEIIYNFCYPHPYSITDICAAFAEVAGYRLPREIPKPMFSLLIGAIRLVDGKNSSKFAPDRLQKLIHSTDVAPGELLRRGFNWPTELKTGLERWRVASPGNEHFD